MESLGLLSLNLCDLEQNELAEGMLFFHLESCWASQGGFYRAEVRFQEVVSQLGPPKNHTQIKIPQSMTSGIPLSSERIWT